jgi:hypothetical protein
MSQPLASVTVRKPQWQNLFVEPAWPQAAQDQPDHGEQREQRYGAARPTTAPRGSGAGRARPRAGRGRVWRS